MAKLLYTALAPDGTRAEGVVNAPSAVAAREQLEQQGFTEVTLRPEATPSDRPAVPSGIDAGQHAELARFRQLLLHVAPSLKEVLLAQARQSRLWLVADAGLVLFGLFSAQPVWVAAGVLAALAPLALTAWSFSRADRHQQLLSQYALGQWDAVRALAKDLRGAAGLRPEREFDLDVRLACIYARDHTLADALQRLEPWRKRLATQPGAFEAGVAQAHLMAGDTAGHVAQLGQAHERAPHQVSRAIEHALAQSRFGSIAHAEALLGRIEGGSLSADERALVLWARGLLQLRRREPTAVGTLSQAVAAALLRAADPATWPALAMCACDHAVALHEAGHHEAARERIGQVWPVLEVHATVPLLRMLEADDLLPVRSTPNT